MAMPVSGIPEIKRLLIVRLGAMGDIIHALPAVTALRDALPEATFGWVVEERWAELLSSPGIVRCGARSPQKPLVDNLHLVNTKVWRHTLFSDRTWSEVLASMREIRAPQYDAAIDFQGAVRSAAIARLARPRSIYGFAHPRERIATLFYTRPIEGRGAHVIEQNVYLASALLRAPLPVAWPEFPSDEVATQQAQTIVIRRQLKRYAILNPGAGWGAKQWPAERYGEVAHRLSEQTGMGALINYGPGEERLAWRVQEFSKGAAHPVTCSVSELIALTRGAELFIGGDTGPLHLAAALKVPVVAIFGPTHPARNGPFGTRSVVLRNPSSPTTHARSRQPDPGMLQISCDDVVAAAIQLLRGACD
jgi:heptosyltransferase I